MSQHPKAVTGSTPAGGAGRGLFGSACLCLLALAAFAGSGAPVASAAEPCPNEAIRDAQGAFAKALPDCRAYELVSPGGNPLLDSFGEAGYSRASTTGNRFAYNSYYPTDNAQSSSIFYLATRGEGGWSTQPAAPQESPTASPAFACEQELNYTPDLSKSVLGDGLHEEPYCQSAEEELAPGAPSGYRNLFLREDATVGSYRLVDVTPLSAVPGNAIFVAGSADFSHIVFTDEAQLTPEAPAGASLYEWAGGVVHLVTFLPGGEPTQGEIAGTNAGSVQSVSQAHHAVSTDGERVYFTTQSNLYMRENAAQPQSLVNGEGRCTEPSKACTVQIDKSNGPGASGGGSFAEGSADGSKVFFGDGNQLTADAEPGGGLYEYDVQTGQLTYLAPAGFAGASKDGSYVYLISANVLTGAEENEHHEKAEPGKSNMYLLHAGDTSFVAGDSEGGQVSPNGRFFAFTSRKPLTGYDNTPANPEDCIIFKSSEQVPCTEIFLYDANTGQLSCASCGPEGSVPAGDNLLAGARQSGATTPSAVYLPRSVDENGRVFFDTKNALVPQDENEARDVYEYGNGQPHLISSGIDPSGSTFYDASLSGNDVFFATAQRLLPSDTNSNDSVYDARVGGGFSEPPPPSPCEGEACRVGGTVASGNSSKATASFSGPGNPKVAGCKKGFVRKNGKCVKKPKHHGRHHHHRAAGHARRAGR